eukprot:scaffold50276_cov62-Phaeocystis_antarctica.AAC.3
MGTLYRNVKVHRTAAQSTVSHTMRLYHNSQLPSTVDLTRTCTRSVLHDTKLTTTFCRDPPGARGGRVVGDHELGTAIGGKGLGADVVEGTEALVELTAVLGDHPAALRLQVVEKRDHCARVAVTEDGLHTLEAQRGWCQVVVGVERQNGAAREEVTPHPVARVAHVRRALVADRLHKEGGAGPQPVAHRVDHRGVEHDALTHLRLGGLGEVGVVLYVKSDVLEPALLRLARDEGDLLRRVGECGEAEVGEARRVGERERAPAAAELEDLAALGERGEARLLLVDQ